MTLTQAERTALGREALETPARVRVQFEKNAEVLNDLAARLRTKPPRFVVTCARGSSDHASMYGKTLIENFAGRAVASVGMSIASVYDRKLDLTDSLFIAVSQSGRSPDLLRLTEMAKDQGATIVGLVNDETAPLNELADVALPLCAGPEKSVAATKSYLLSCSAFLNLVAKWTDDKDLNEAVAQLPDAFEAATKLDWWPYLQQLQDTRNMFVLGRGLSFGAALETALKLKETSRIHAEAFSAAEVIHGPLGLAGTGLPVLALGQEDEAAQTIRDTIARITELEGTVLSAIDAPNTTRLPTVPGIQPVIQPLTQLLSFYVAVQHLAVSRGIDPDNPPNLRKVTETR
ncbi:SIS domain-containing protein [Pseudovibrio sp. SPO723]|uniref:SIS domain-containing protein n=1 Tax=Nesiotobacter zosterae TaxID=392721 RepID=UPI0029C30198|nr:SIS domain-containing protein [Pseudovibrio sp. SPO723]MDX5594802.1 SIS domain-containing protein [Pseudovibrio sp. SPO723]